MTVSTHQHPCNESYGSIATGRIGIVTPAPPGSRRGNRVTAERWAGIVREIGYPADLIEEYSHESFDALIVLHAGRSSRSVHNFRARYPDRPIVVAITGTDLYGNSPNPAEVSHSLEAADRIVVLQSQTALDVPALFRPKVRVIVQSARAIAQPDLPRSHVFEVAVVGHLREVKDPFRASEASRLLPADSTIRVVQFGAALSSDMADRARQEMATNWRYSWLGDLPHEDALRVLSLCRLMAVTSVSEGGPAVIAESIVAGVPVLATRVAGCVGMLGNDYPGLYSPRDTRGLADLMWRAEIDSAFYQTLQRSIAERQPLFQPAAEFAKWRDLLVELGIGRPPLGA